MLNFQGQPLTPFGQTAQQSRRGFDALLGVVRDEIETKRRADAMKQNVQAQKDVITFQSEESMRVQREMLPFQMDALEQSSEIQNKYAIERAVQLNNKVEMPRAQAKAQADAIANFQEKSSIFSNRVVNNFHENDRNLINIAGVAVPINGYIDPDTGLEMVNIVQTTRDENGRRVQRTAQLPYVDFISHNQRFAPVASFIEEFDRDRHTLEVSDRMTTAAGDGILSTELIGSETAAEMVAEIRNGGPLAEQYITKIAEGRVALNRTENNAIATEQRRRAVDAARVHGTLMANFNSIADSGSYKVRGGGWIFRNNYNFDIERKSVGELLREFRDFFDKENTSPAKLAETDIYLSGLYDSLQLLLAEYSSENNDNVDPNALFINTRVQAPELNQIFIRRPPTQENEIGGTRNERTILGASNLVGRWLGIGTETSIN
jgi:hypothetical protein